VQAGVTTGEETLIELLHVLFVGLWVAGELNDSEQPSCDEALENTWGMGRCSREVEVQVQAFFK